MAYYPFDWTCACRQGCLTFRRPGQYLWVRMPNATGGFYPLQNWVRVDKHPGAPDGCLWVKELDPIAPLTRGTIEFEIGWIPGDPLPARRRWLTSFTYGPFGVEIVSWEAELSTGHWPCENPQTPQLPATFPPSTRFPSGSATGIPIEFRWGNAGGPPP